MKCSLIICTYKRPTALCTLLNSVEKQSLYPDEILVIDGSPDEQTKEILAQRQYRNLQYYQVTERDRGLTRQRNFGIRKVGDEAEIVCFLDDDTVLDATYFEEIIKAFHQHPEALGVGGYIYNEVQWEKTGPGKIFAGEFYFDGWKRKEGSRFVLRKRLGLDSDVPPGFMPKFGHGRSVGFLPPSGKIYPVEQFMGGASAFRKSVFDVFSFSTFFEGYGLYEDADFTLRLSKAGKLFVQTAARLAHFHEPSGRPRHFRYGKMVVRNGWYVWRIKHPKPNLKNNLKWHAITGLLILIRFSNTLTGRDKKAAFDEALGRLLAWFSLLFSKPK